MALDRSPMQQILRPFEDFVRLETFGGILLFAATLAALIWANSPFSHSYVELWETHLKIGAGSFVLDQSVHHWINDGLMAIFFFVVGLEIKREFLEGELSIARKAALPIMAALGGMLAPAAIYVALNSGTEGSSGWGVPMATDIAFALGVLTLLGNRIPLSLKIFLTALAIVDDIGAVLVIAFFYTAHISWMALAIAGVFLLLLGIGNVSGARHPLFYTIFGICVWLAFLKSGVHATIAGVLVAMTVPHRPRIKTLDFVNNGRSMLEQFEKAEDFGVTPHMNEEQQGAVRALEVICENVQTPLVRLEHMLHPLVTFLIMPVFALANAGVELDIQLAETIGHPVSLGIIAGLVLGKQLGITLFSWLAVKLRFAAFPEGVSMKDIYGVSWLGGIGFTMSLFIAALAFEGGELLTVAKLGILIASLMSGIVGYFLLRTKSRL